MELSARYSIKRAATFPRTNSAHTFLLREPEGRRLWRHGLRVRELAGTRFDPKIVDALEVAVKAGKLKLSATLVEV